MKKLIYSMMVLAISVFAFTSCEDVPMPYTIPEQEGGGGGGSTDVEPSGSGTADDPYNIAAILEVAGELAQGESTTEQYYFKGIVSSVSEISTSYGNATFYLADEGSTKTFEVYHAYGPGNQKITDENLFEEGDTIVMCGKLTNYNGTLETVSNGAYIVSINGEGGGEEEKVIEVTCAKAREIALALEDKATTSETYAVTGYITSIAGSVSKNQQSFWMADTTDDGKVFEAYWANLPEGVDEFVQGTKVKITGNIMRYGSTPEIKNATVTIIE